MTEASFEIFSDIAYLYKILLRILLFYVLWKIFYPQKLRESIKQIFEKREILKIIFLNLLFWNFHSLSFLISNSAYQFIESRLLSDYVVQTMWDMPYVYKSMAIGMGGMFLLYTFVFVVMLWGIKMFALYQRMEAMKLTEFIFLSVLNIVGWMFAQMVSKLMIVKIETEVFILFDARAEFLWWIPLMAILLYCGEIAVIYAYQKYVEKQEERELLFIENQQVKILKQRLEDVEGFYENIRKVRHEMRNHMTNIKGLVSNNEYDEAARYIYELDTSMQALEYKFSTGNPVMDVLVNDKWKRAEKLGIRFEVDICYNTSISVYDMAIILNNLLDNAIEASEKIGSEKRYIKIKMKRKHRFVLVEVENAFDGRLKWENGVSLPTTTKQTDALAEHGIGLKNVKDVTNRYFGDLDIKVQDHIFKITVLLQEKEEEYHANYDTND